MKDRLLGLWEKADDGLVEAIHKFDQRLAGRLGASTERFRWCLLLLFWALACLTLPYWLLLYVHTQISSAQLHFEIACLLVVCVTGVLVVFLPVVQPLIYLGHLWLNRGVPRLLPQAFQPSWVLHFRRLHLPASVQPYLHLYNFWAGLFLSMPIGGCTVVALLVYRDWALYLVCQVATFVCLELAWDTALKRVRPPRKRREKRTSLHEHFPSWSVVTQRM